MNPSDVLRAMADRIDRIEAADFAGCLVVIPPSARPGSQNLVNDPIEHLFVDPNHDPAYFWASAYARLSVAKGAFEESAREPLGFRR